MTVMRYNDPFLCGFNVRIKGLTSSSMSYDAENAPSLTDSTLLVRQPLQLCSLEHLNCTYHTRVSVAIAALENIISLGVVL